jgi:ribonuclease Z
MLQLAGIAVDAVSVGGLETCIQLPGYDLAIDIGRCPRSSVYKDTILITHGHMDHIGGICYHAATRGMMGLEPPTYVVGPEYTKAVSDLFNAYRRLDRSALNHKLVTIGPGDELPLTNGRVARPFRSIHRIPCQGYGIWSTKKKLRAEYMGLPGIELRDLRLSGVEISDTVEAPELAFTGDTLIEVVEREEVVRKARLLIMEVTFVDDRVTVEQCRSKGHIHLDEIAERADLFENEAILFTHFSGRYRGWEIREALRKRLPERLLSRVTPLLGSHE